MTKIIDAAVNFHDGETYGRKLIIEHSQEIPDSFLDSLKAQRFESQNAPMGDFHRVASIPAVVYEKWLRDGYDAQKEPIAKTLAKLRHESLEYFITTNKRF